MTRSPVVSSMAIGLVLCACAPATQQQTGTSLVGGARAFAVPGSGGPAIVGVVERRYSNAVEQTIALETHADTGGQNSLGVRVLGLARANGDDALVPTVMTDATIAGEMRAAFPGVAMSISPAFVQNAYGPFGYAVGRGAGRDLCLYGWQRIGGEVTTPFVRQGAIETRLRLCQSAADERTLLANMYAYTVQASFGPNWSTGSPPPALPMAIGATGAPIYPAAFQMATAAPPEQVRRPSRPAARISAPLPDQEAAAATAAFTLPAPAVPAPAGATVPAPAGAMTAPMAAPSFVPAPFVPAPVFPLEALPIPAMTAAAVSGTPHVPPPPTRVVVPGISGAAAP